MFWWENNNYTYYLVTAKLSTPALWTETVQKKVDNVERHGHCVAFVNPLQPHTSSREFPLYKCVFLRKAGKISVGGKVFLKCNKDHGNVDLESFGTAATATSPPLNKRFNQQNNGCARALFEQ